MNRQRHLYKRKDKGSSFTPDCRDVDRSKTIETRRISFTSAQSRRDGEDNRPSYWNYQSHPHIRNGLYLFCVSFNLVTHYMTAARARAVFSIFAHQLIYYINSLRCLIGNHFACEIVRSACVSNWDQVNSKVCAYKQM